MNPTTFELFEKWQADPSFINWANKANEIDIAKWNAYFKSNPQHAELGELVKFAILDLQSSVQTQTVDKHKSQLALKALRQQIATATKRNNTTASIFRLPSAWKIAASVLLLIGLGIWMLVPPVSSPNEIVWQATPTEKQEILLPDGTKVTLNKNARLSYLDKEVRKVRLEGEAYFEVTKQPSTQATFSVTTNDLVVKVLGTEFNVKTNQEKTSVFLDEGKVKLALADNHSEELEMNPGELVSYSKKQQKVLENRKASSLKNTAWKESVITLEEASLSEFLAIIHDIYGINFEVNSDINQTKTFTGGIPVDDLDITLKTIETSYGIAIQRVEAKYMLEKK